MDSRGKFFVLAITKETEWKIPTPQLYLKTEKSKAVVNGQDVLEWHSRCK